MKLTALDLTNTVISYDRTQKRTPELLSSGSEVSGKGTLSTAARRDWWINSRAPVERNSRAATPFHRCAKPGKGYRYGIASSVLFYSDRRAHGVDCLWCDIEMNKLTTGMWLE